MVSSTNFIELPCPAAALPPRPLSSNCNCSLNIMLLLWPTHSSSCRFRADPSRAYKPAGSLVCQGSHVTNCVIAYGGLQTGVNYTLVFFNSQAYGINVTFQYSLGTHRFLVSTPSRVSLDQLSTSLSRDYAIDVVSTDCRVPDWISSAERRRICRKLCDDRGQWGCLRSNPGNLGQ